MERYVKWSPYINAVNGNAHQALKLCLGKGAFNFLPMNTIEIIFCWKEKQLIIFCLYCFNKQRWQVFRALEKKSFIN